MNLNEIQERINRLLSFFVTEVKGATAMGRTDINHVSEVILVPLLSKVFGYSNLVNLNQTEHVNQPAIDLGDCVAGVAFQVTSTSNNKKVKETLTKFVKFELYKQYNHLMIYNLAEKQDSYSGEGFDEIIQGRFRFDKNKDIIDYRDILRAISSFQVNDALEIQHMLENNFSAGDFFLIDTPERVKRREELMEKHLRILKTRIGRVRLLGDRELHDLTEVFVELTVLKDRERPSSRTRTEYWEMMDAELRERRDPFAWHRDDSSMRGVGRSVRPAELLKAGTHAVLSGAPGGGKSTLMKYLALKSMIDQDSLPLFLELNMVDDADFAAAHGNIPELLFSKSLAETVCETDSDRSLLRAGFYKKLRAGEAAIFLDGLDEVSGTGFFDELRLSVKDFLRHDDYRKNRVFMSSRPYALLDHFGRDEAREYEILPLDRGQIERFVRHYYDDDTLAPAFLAELWRRRDLRDLASVPALLGFLLILYRTPGVELPEDRLELYRLLVRKLAGEWDKEKPAKRAFQTTNTRRIAFLGHLAFSRLFDAAGSTPYRRFIFTGQEIFTEAERYCISKGIAIQPDILTEEVKATALLREVGADDYAFAHLTLQEYMAATTLFDQTDRAERFCRGYFDQTLSEMEVLPIFLGLVGHQPELYNALKALPESVDHKQLRLRARSLAYGHPPDWLSAELGDRLDECIRRVGQIEYGYSDLFIRAFSAVAGQVGEVIAHRIARRLAHDEPEYVRSYAVQAAGIIGNEAVSSALRLAMEEDPDPSVRVDAASRLALKDERAALDLLTQELVSGDDDVKDKVIYALWNFGSERAVEVLEEAAHTYPAVRKHALEALASFRESVAIPTLAQYLSDPDDRVRSTVVNSLGEIGGANVIPHLIKAVDDRDVDIAERAVEFLGQIGGEEVIQYLSNLLENRSGKLVGAVAEALGRAGAFVSISKLAQLLDKYKDDDSDDNFPRVIFGGWINGYVRAKIAGALCELGDEGGHNVLVELITKEYSEERREAAKALARCRPHEVKALLPGVISNIKFTDWLSEYDLAALADILYDMDACDDPRVVNAMIDVLNNSRSQLNSTTSVATNVLGHVGDQAAVGALTKAAERGDTMLQLAAMTALGNIADENTVPALLSGLTTGMNPVSQYAPRGLSRVENSAMYLGLKHTAHHKYAKVRRKVARCLFYYPHDEEGVQLISGLAASDPSEKIKETAREAALQLECKRRLFE
jgi:HEAT repeat protein